MTLPTPVHRTRHRTVFTVAADLDTLLCIVDVGCTLAIADPVLAARLALPPPPIPPGRLRDSVIAEAAAADVPANAVFTVALAIIDAAVTLLLPPTLRRVELPPTVIVGGPEQATAVLAAAEAVAASNRGGGAP